MITKVEIFNFQSWEHLEIDFSNGVNVIIGQTDAGKSAIIRAITWALTNEPRGDWFRSTWGGETRVTLHFSDGNIISRVKGSENLYILNGSELKAFGSGVPEEVQKAINIGDINMKSQLDAHFLLGVSSGQVATFFNKIANIDIIDHTSNNIKSTIRSLNSDVKSTEKLIKEGEESLQDYSFIDKFEADVEVLEDMQSQVSVISSSVINLMTILKQLEECDAKIQEVDEQLSAEQDLDKILIRMESRDVTLQDIQELDKLLDSFQLIDDSIQELDDILEMGEDMKPIISKFARLRDITSNVTSLEEIVDQVYQIETEEQEIEAKLVELETIYHDNFPDICPLCETDLSKRNGSTYQKN